MIAHCLTIVIYLFVGNSFAIVLRSFRAGSGTLSGCILLAIDDLLLANAQSAQVQQLLSAVRSLIVIMCPGHYPWVMGSLFSINQ